MLLYVYLFFTTFALHIQASEITIPLNNGIDLVITQGDIINSECSAIVNAANENLQSGAGVCGAIFNAAGKQCLQKECNKFFSIENEARCKTGDAVITDSCNLKEKKVNFIIHAVGPIFNKEKNIDEQNTLLKSAYQKSLSLAEKSKISSIAFPLISAGIFGYPVEEACDSALTSIVEFTNNLANNAPVLKKINMVLFEEKYYNAFKNSIADLLEKSPEEGYMILANKDKIKQNKVDRELWLLAKSQKFTSSRVLTVHIWKNFKNFFSKFLKKISLSSSEL